MAGLFLPFILSESRTQAAEIILQPVSASGPHTILGTQIKLSSGGQRVFLEIKIKGFAPDILSRYQMKLNSAGYASGASGLLGPASQPCPGTGSAGNNFCRTTFNDSGVGASRCVDADIGPDILLQCEAAWINQTRTDWVMFGHGTVSVVDVSSPDYRWANAAFPGDEATDNGSIFYAGALAVDVPSNAAGTFTIGFVLEETWLQNEGNPPDNNITPLIVTSARITIMCNHNAQCDDGNVCTADYCQAGACVNCELAHCVDWNDMAACLLGPSILLGPACEDYDLDGDGFVDMLDVYLFMRP